MNTIIINHNLKSQFLHSLFFALFFTLMITVLIIGETGDSIWGGVMMAIVSFFFMLYSWRFAYLERVLKIPFYVITDEKITINHIGIKREIFFSDVQEFSGFRRFGYPKVMFITFKDGDIHKGFNTKRTWLLRTFNDIEPDADEYFNISFMDVPPQEIHDILIEKLKKSQRKSS